MPSRASRAGSRAPGPTLTGVQKPEIMAPGAAIIGALSQQAVPPAPDSIFTNPPARTRPATGTNPDCQQVDAYHAASFGTSFSSPLVAGTVAILFQHDPTLTQDKVLAALQGGAHPLRGPAQFADQASVGEVDVLGAVTAADRTRKPAARAARARTAAGSTLGADVYLADGSTPLEAILELRADATASGAAAARRRIRGRPSRGVRAGRRPARTPAAVHVARAARARGVGRRGRAARGPRRKQPDGRGDVRRVADCRAQDDPHRDGRVERGLSAERPRADASWQAGPATAAGAGAILVALGMLWSRSRRRRRE